MRPAAQVQACIELLDQINETGYPADRCMAGYFKQRRYIGSKDKAAISEHLYTVLRNKLSYEYLLQQKGLGTHSRLLAAAMLHVKGESVKQYFNGEHYSPAVLRKEQVEAFADLDPSILNSAPINVRLNVPEWIAGHLQKALGERFEAEMSATNTQATTDIRVNTLKSSVASVYEALKGAGYELSNTKLSPWGLRFGKRVSLFGLEAFKKGWFEIQDEGSQLLALLSGAKAGEKVVDFCAGAGGKTLAMAAMMENKGVIYATDVHTKRLEQLSKRCKRAGAHNTRVHTLSSEHDKWVKKHKAMADLVLIDAPCSGTGTWRRNPDARWNLQPDNLANLIELQQSILQSAKRLVKPGGRLIYATCSLLNEENEQQVERFLQGNPEFTHSYFELPEPLSQQDDAFVYSGSQFRTFPGLTGTDGFFAACLLRVAE